MQFKFISTSSNALYLSASVAIWALAEDNLNFSPARPSLDAGAPTSGGVAVELPHTLSPLLAFD